MVVGNHRGVLWRDALELVEEELTCLVEMVKV